MWVCYPWLEMCQVCLLTAIDFALALLACRLVHTRCMCRNRCVTQTLEMDTQLGLEGCPAQPHEAPSSTIPTQEEHGMFISGTPGQLPPAWWDEHSPSLCSSPSAFKINLSYYCNSLLEVETISLGTSYASVIRLFNR